MVSIFRKFVRITHAVEDTCFPNSYLKQRIHLRLKGFALDLIEFKNIFFYLENGDVYLAGKLISFQSLRIQFQQENWEDLTTILSTPHHFNTHYPQIEQYQCQTHPTKHQTEQTISEYQQQEQNKNVETNTSTNKESKLTESSRTIQQNNIAQTRNDATNHNAVPAQARVQININL
ncbi:Hypothetical_protein [Hexamita inflata]|uniref:Hypothetical_protein n=1 Tax=Hexamita inflata TaxID=28002 RepID=A0ABP1GEZ1_9EUKA